MTVSALWWLVLAAIVVVVAVAVLGALWAIRARRSGTVLAARPTDRNNR